VRLVFSLTVLTVAVVFALEPQGQRSGPYRVLEVTDGDTLELESLGSVRLIGIDTPENYEGQRLEKQARKHALPETEIQVLGEQASQTTAELLNGQSVYLELGVEQRDRYGRLLA
jgi:micrococcal nuclease